MNHQNFFLTVFAGAVMALTAGCDDSGSGGEPTGTGTGTTTGTGTGTGTTTGGVPLKADKGGFVAKDSNTLGIQGAWYAYADSLGASGTPPGACQAAGHSDAECSKVTAPAPGMGFAPTDETADQKLCTEGTVEAVLNGSNGMPDYGNMWGAGIGLDFNNPGMGAMKTGFNASAANVKGISFDIDTPPLAGIRVEIPDAKTNGKAAAYWEATTSYGPSPVKAGTNTFTWDKVLSPDPANVPALDPSSLYGLQFHVVSGAAGSYKFCISHVKMLQ